MLIALLSVLLFGGGGSDRLLDFNMVEKQIESVMADTDEREAALKALKAAEEKYENYNERIQDWRKQLSELLLDPMVDDAELDAIWDDYFNATEKWHGDVVDARIEMKQYISREEWTKIFTAPQD